MFNFYHEKYKTKTKKNNVNSKNIEKLAARLTKLIKHTKVNKINFFKQSIKTGLTKAHSSLEKKILLIFFQVKTSQKFLEKNQNYSEFLRV